MKESELQSRVKRHLQDAGWGVWNLHGNAYQPGLPDLLVKPPHSDCFFIELKMPKGRLTKAQRVRFPELEEAGLEIFVISSDDPEHICQVLSGSPNWKVWRKTPKEPPPEKIYKQLEAF